MKILVCGSRFYADYSIVYKVIKSFGADITIISGACRGADTLAVRVAQELDIPFKEYPANWALYGKKAGIIRNQQMIDLESPDLVVAFSKDIENSRGTKSTIKMAKQKNIDTIIIS